jgi:hypothetical protein
VYTRAQERERKKRITSCGRSVGDERRPDETACCCDVAVELVRDGLRTAVLVDTALCIVTVVVDVVLYELVVSLGGLLREVDDVLRFVTDGES